MNLFEKITEIYLNEEFWHDKKLSREEANEYHRRMLLNGNILTVSDGETLAGYCEYFIQDGVCFINSLYIKEGYRGKKVIWMLKKRLFQVARGCRIFLGERNKFNMKYPEAQLRSQHGI